jgi:uncharacterized protein (TIGR04255 family)
VNTYQNEDLKLLRSMHQLHIMKDDSITSVINYGIINKEYPNPIARPEFILDYDCYLTGELTVEEVLKKIIELNKIISDLFDKDITEKLKEIMGV